MTLKKKMLLTLAVPVFALLGMNACAPVTLLNTITPTGSYSAAKDISFGADKRQELDIYRADKPRAGSPVLVFIHGGSWDSGHKGMYKFLAEGFTSEGFDVAVPNYRLYPEVIYPEFLSDNAAAIAKVAETFPDRPLVVMGHSAGGYNALMLSLDPTYFAAANVDMCARISGIVGLSSPTGIVPLTGETLIKIFPDRFTGKDAPLNIVNGPTPAMFLMNGAEDTTVYPQNSIKLAELVQARGGQASATTYPDMNHTDPVKVLSRHFDGDATLKDDIIAFIDGLPKSGNFCR